MCVRGWRRQWRWCCCCTFCRAHGVLHALFPSLGLACCGHAYALPVAVACCGCVGCLHASQRIVPSQCMPSCVLTADHVCVLSCRAAGGDALERGHHVNTVVFDKTGTLTRGRPQVTEAVLFNSHYSLQQVCQLAAAVESSSEHPLAKAVLEFAQAELSRPSPTAVFNSSAVDLKASSKQQQQQSAAPAGPHTVVTVAMYSLEDEDGSSPRCGGKQQQQQRHGVLRHSSSSSGPDVGWGGSSSSPRQRRGSCEMQPGLVSRLGKQLANSTGGLAAWAGHSEGGEGPGSPVSTPKRLGRMLNSGMLKVSEVEVSAAAAGPVPCHAGCSSVCCCISTHCVARMGWGCTCGRWRVSRYMTAACIKPRRPAQQLAFCLQSTQAH